MKTNKSKTDKMKEMNKLPILNLVTNTNKFYFIIEIFFIFKTFTIKTAD